MKNIPIDEIPPVLKDQNIVGEKAKAILDGLQKIINEIKAERDANKTPKQKYQTIFVLSDPDKVLPEGTELTGWVVQIKEGDDAGEILKKIDRAGYEFNSSKKGKKNPVKSVGEALMHITRKFFKAEDLTIKTKEPVRILISDNALKNQPKKSDL